MSYDNGNPPDGPMQMMVSVLAIIAMVLVVGGFILWGYCAPKDAVSTKWICHVLRGECSSAAINESRKTATETDSIVGDK